jgi:hypothetical protein
VRLVLGGERVAQREDMQIWGRPWGKDRPSAKAQDLVLSDGRRRRVCAAGANASVLVSEFAIDCGPRR